MKNKSSLFSFLIYAPKIAVFLGIMISLWGLLSYFTIAKENAPYIAYGVVNISIPYAGVSAADMNDLVTEKIEAKIKNISGLSSYSSVSSNGLSTITLEFQPDQDMVKAMSDVRSKVAESKSSLPSDLDNDPIITEIDSSLTPFFTVVLSGNVSALSLHDYAKGLERALERVNGVSKISISGGAERQMMVRLDTNKMKTYGLGVDEVVATLRNSNKDVPVGEITLQDKEYVLRFEGKLKTVQDVENITIKNIQKDSSLPASLLVLKDIATVEELGMKDHAITRFNQNNAIFLSISRNTSGDIFSTDERTRKAVEEYAAKNFPSTITVSYANEVLPQIKKSFDEVFGVGYEAVFIVMMVIFLFVGILEGIVSALIIPITILFTIGVLATTGSSLNFMTNFSMILALGILVDNAIVIVQGTYQKMKNGMEAKEAALSAVSDFKAPLISGTLTTLSVFLPLLSLPGVLGQYLAFIPITVSIALASSLVIALFLISSYTASVLPWASKFDNANNPIAKMLHAMRENIDHFIESTYGNFLRNLLHSQTVRLSLLVVSIFSMGLSTQLPTLSQQFPAGDSELLTISIEKAVGTPEELVLPDIIPLEKWLLGLPEVKQVSTTIASETATINIELLAIEEREDKKLKTSMELEKDINAYLPSIKNAQSQLTSQQNGPPSESPVAFRVITNDAQKIENAKFLTQKLTDLMKTVEGTSGVKNNIKEIPGEYRFTIDREKAIQLQISPDSIASQIRTIISGTTATTITRSGQDIDIVVEYDQKNITSINDITNISILSLNGSLIPLSDIVKIQQYGGVKSMFREDGDLAFTISSFLGTNADGTTGNADKITKEFKQKIEEYKKTNAIPEGINIIDAGEGAENEELNNAMMVGGLTALFLMYFIVFLQFRSFIQPFIILQTIIFAQIGVNIGLYLFDIPKSLAYTLGLITLFGIIVNHAIILIDQINKNRNLLGDSISYAQTIDLVVHGCVSRFHPVVMTGIATIAGLIPLLAVDEFWYGLASTIIFGLIMATVLIFFITPATYIQFEKDKWKTFAVIFIATFLTALFCIFVI